MWRFTKKCSIENVGSSEDGRRGMQIKLVLGPPMKMLNLSADERVKLELLEVNRYGGDGKQKNSAADGGCSHSGTRRAI